MATPNQDPTIGYLDGYRIEFKRRRYGRQTFTWLLAARDGEPLRELPCDPWPCTSPKRREVHAEVLRHVYGVLTPADIATASDPRA